MNNATKVVVGFALAILLLGLVGTGAVLAADSAKPGDVLYPLDQLGEDVQRAFTTNDDERAELEMKILDERKEELEALEEADDGRIEDAIDHLEEQESTVQERLRAMNENSEMDEGEKTRVTERSEEQVEAHEQVIEKVQEKLRESQNDEVADKLEKVKNKYENRPSLDRDENNGNNGSNGNR
ncbi:hypothetical protein GF389_04855 [Candidatus Dojkabacteria bacterium]|nr:hypothetical protein [Candidatus Dojkabacteria bacterium]